MLPRNITSHRRLIVPNVHTVKPDNVVALVEKLQTKVLFFRAIKSGKRPIPAYGSYH
jgi:hypothetical protein